MHLRILPPLNLFLQGSVRCCLPITLTAYWPFQSAPLADHFRWISRLL